MQIPIFSYKKSANKNAVRKGEIRNNLSEMFPSNHTSQLLCMDYTFRYNQAILTNEKENDLWASFPSE